MPHPIKCFRDVKVHGPDITRRVTYIKDIEKVLNICTKEQWHYWTPLLFYSFFEGFAPRNLKRCAKITSNLLDVSLSQPMTSVCIKSHILLRDWESFFPSMDNLFQGIPFCQEGDKTQTHPSATKISKENKRVSWLFLLGFNVLLPVKFLWIFRSRCFRPKFL